jgi:hypothetical protein
MREQSFKRESSRKYAKLGNSTTKSLIAMAAIMFFLLYVTSVGVSASNGSTLVSSPVAPNANYHTRTVTKTIVIISPTTTTTTLTDTTTSTATSTATVTSTTTSVVCCETSTSTTTVTEESNTVTTTITATPNVTSGAGSDSCESGEACVADYGVTDPVFTAPATSINCQVTITISTANFGNQPTVTSLELQWGDSSGNTYYSYPTGSPSADVTGYTTTLSAQTVSIHVYVLGSLSSDLQWHWAYTAICPSS